MFIWRRFSWLFDRQGVSSDVTLGDVDVTRLPTFAAGYLGRHWSHPSRNGLKMLCWLSSIEWCQKVPDCNQTKSLKVTPKSAPRTDRCLGRARDIRLAEVHKWVFAGFCGCRPSSVDEWAHFSLLSPLWPWESIETGAGRGEFMNFIEGRRWKRKRFFALPPKRRIIFSLEPNNSLTAVECCCCFSFIREFFLKKKNRNGGAGRESCKKIRGVLMRNERR